MFKFIAILLAVVIVASAKPGYLAGPVAYSSPLVAAAPAIVTAHSSQVIARNYNGLAAAPLVAAPVAYSAPALAYSTPFAYQAPIAYSAYAAPTFAAASPLKYTALL